MRTAVRTLLCLYGVYVGTVILVVLPLLNTLPSAWLQQQYGRSLHSDIILFNPFTLNLQARNAKLSGRSGTPFAAAGLISANLSIATLWRPGWIFDALTVEGLSLHIRRSGSGVFNFSDLMPAATDSASPDDSSAPLPVTVQQLIFHADTLSFSDETRQPWYQSQLSDLAFNVRGFSTTMEQGQPYQLDITGEHRGTLHWQGEVSLPGRFSRGQITLSELDLRPLWRFAEPWLRFVLNSGRLSINSAYQLSWQRGLSYHIGGGELNLSDLSIVDKAAIPAREIDGQQDNAVQLELLSGHDINVDSEGQQVSIGDLDVNGLRLSGWNDRGIISTVELFTPDLPQQNSDTTGAGLGKTDWDVTVGGTRLNASVDWDSPFTEPRHLRITPLTAALGTVHWPFSGDTTLDLAIALNDTAQLHTAGAVTLADGSGHLDYRIENLPLTLFNPNLPGALHARITDGALNAQGRMDVQAFTPTRLSMQGAIEHFSGRAEAEENAITQWQSVRWRGLDLNIPARRFDLAELNINHYQGRLHIHKDGTVNAQRAWQADQNEQREAATPAENPDTTPATPPWQITMPKVVITGSSLDFTDESLPLPFRSVIGDLRGTITDIVSKPDTSAQVSLSGSVDGYAPVTLTGTAHPLLQPPALNLRLNFDGVDMATLSPYAATYAGYAIAQGLLSLRLDYALQDNRLHGDNRLLLEQMQLGAATHSDKALDIPIKLALALLTDASGKIDLQVPVTGTVDDPDFSLGNVIFQAFSNLLVKALTAPFTLLAGLVDSEEDLQHIAFAPGRDDLDEATRATLDKLAEALVQRPQLTLSVAGRIDPVRDRAALQGLHLRDSLLASGLTKADIDNRSDGFRQLIDSRFIALDTASQALATDSGGDITLDQKWQQLSLVIHIEDAALIDLAMRRANAVKTYLVTRTGLPSTRAVIAQFQLSDDPHQSSAVELNLDS